MASIYDEIYQRMAVLRKMTRKAKREIEDWEFSEDTQVVVFNDTNEKEWVPPYDSVLADRLLSYVEGERSIVNPPTRTPWTFQPITGCRCAICKRARLLMLGSVRVWDEPSVMGGYEPIMPSWEGNDSPWETSFRIMDDRNAGEIRNGYVRTRLFCIEDSQPFYQIMWKIKYSWNDDYTITDIG